MAPVKWTEGAGEGSVARDGQGRKTQCRRPFVEPLKQKGKSLGRERERDCAAFSVPTFAFVKSKIQKFAFGKSKIQSLLLGKAKFTAGVFGRAFRCVVCFRSYVAPRDRFSAWAGEMPFWKRRGFQIFRHNHGCGSLEKAESTVTLAGSAVSAHCISGNIFRTGTAGEVRFQNRGMYATTCKFSVKARKEVGDKWGPRTQLEAGRVTKVHF